MSLMLLGILNSQVAGGAAGAFDLLETQVLSSSAASVTFTGLGSYTDYKHLQLRITGRSTRSGSNTAGIFMQFNSDSSSNYSEHSLLGDGSSVYSSANANANTAAIISVPAGNQASNIYAGFVIDILDFSKTNKYKTIRNLAGFHGNSSSQLYLESGNWRSASAITSIYLYDSSGNNIVAGSRFSLYGVR